MKLCNCDCKPLSLLPKKKKKKSYLGFALLSWTTSSDCQRWQKRVCERDGVTEDFFSFTYCLFCLVIIISTICYRAYDKWEKSWWCQEETEGEWEHKGETYRGWGWGGGERRGTKERRGERERGSMCIHLCLFMYERGCLYACVTEYIYAWVCVCVCGMEGGCGGYAESY